MIPRGHKNFDDFIELCNNLDWHKYVSDDKNVNEKTIKANIEVTLAILREYYKWDS